ncbi:MAG: (2Fe-2S) ferredoxin domain-containing protein, partial [Pseudonocardia sp.]|nr:(2Fe-2S) ferredoxin domain-containing protein [Pseudonocardia sp.]
PAWSEQPAHGRHVLVCRGPRCTAHGAGETHRAISRAARGTDALVTPVGCLGPCNLGPLVVTVPAGRWHAHVGAEFELAPPETLSVDDRRAPTGDHGEKVVRGDRQATTSP